MKKTLIFFSLLAATALPIRAQDYNKPSAFGSFKPTGESALIGILYDFKQNQKREPVPMDRRTFELLVAQFIDAGWDEGMLNKFYRVSRPLYTTELQIPQMNADAAPKAFGVDKTVQPRMWLVHYKAQVSPPEDGTYRFLGNSDDFVAVAVNGRTVLVADIPGTKLQVKWFAKEKTTLPGSWGAYTAGDWLDLKAGQPIDLDIITGESPGGDYRCFLGIEKKGVDYHGKDNPFQLAVSKKTPPGAVPWKGYP